MEIPPIGRIAETAVRRHQIQTETLPNYEPSNCTWADHATQAKNRRFIKLAPDGRPWFEAARANGIPSRTFNVRVSAGWSREEAATWPYGERRRMTPKDAGTGKFIKA